MKAPLDLAATAGSDGSLTERLAIYRWERIAADLDTYGAAILPRLFLNHECDTAIGLAADPAARPIPNVPEQRAWGTGDNRYFAYPLPGPIADLRTALYPHLTSVANDWNERMGFEERFPQTHAEFLQICRRAQQIVPTSMIFDHRTGQQSLLHQDGYGRHRFPLQAVILLSEPGSDFTGGEFVIAEQRPRMQTRPEVVSLAKGDAVVFATANRPVNGSRGSYRVNLRHGFSKVRTGRQHALEIAFHDAAV